MGFKGTTNVTASIGTVTTGELARHCKLGEKYIGEKAIGWSTLGRATAPDWSIAGRPSPMVWGMSCPVISGTLGCGGPLLRVSWALAHSLVKHF